MSESPSAATPADEVPFAGFIMLFQPRSYWRLDIIVTVVMIPVTMAICAYWGIPPNFDLRQYLFMAGLMFFFSTVLTTAVFLLRCLMLGWPAPVSRRLYFGTYWINIATILVLSWVFSHLKAGVLLGETCDAQLRDMERTVFGGWEAWAFLQRVIPIQYGVFFTVVYWLFMPVVLGTILWCVLKCEESKCNELTCTLVLGYYIGLIGYFLIPSYGPAYVAPEAFPQAFSPRTAKVMQKLLLHTQEVQSNPATAVIVPWKYIAAFPSIHFSHVLILTWFMRYCRLTFVLYSVFTVLTGIATIYLAWHYVADLAGGAAVAILALALMRLARHFGLSGAAPAAGEETVAPVPVPVPA
jgi:hypothetical protein